VKFIVGGLSPGTFSVGGAILPLNYRVKSKPPLFGRLNFSTITEGFIIHSYIIITAILVYQINKSQQYNMIIQNWKSERN